MTARDDFRGYGASLPWFSPEAAPGRPGTPGHLPYYSNLWRDTGCPDLGIPACLGCPLPTCRYDLPPKRAGALVRWARLRALLATGLSVEAAADAIGVSRRTVFRLKRHARADGAAGGDTGA